MEKYENLAKWFTIGALSFSIFGFIHLFGFIVFIKLLSFIVGFIVLGYCLEQTFICFRQGYRDLKAKKATK